MSATFDVAVVGAGMFGAAAAKYLSRAGAKVVVIGPDEPSSPEAAAAQLAFGAHYDDSRIARRLGWDTVWAATDSRSLHRFREIEAESGVELFHECGSLVLMAKSIATRTESILDQSAAAGIAVDRMSEAELERRWPFLRLPPLPGGVEGLHEPRLAGCLSPRRLVAAQLLMTQRAGGSVARGTVTEVTVGRPSKTRRLRVQQNGREAEIRARRVLIAAGAFTNHNGLLPPESRLAMHTFTEPNLLLELDARDAERLQSMPPVITVDPEDTGLGNLSVYLLPPMRSADGRWYLRIGPGMQPIVRQLDSLDEMRAWYIRQQITKEQRAFLTSMWQKLLPDVKPLSVRAACCIIEKTPSRYFYVGQVGNDEGLHVAVGGNGHGARGSDEIGRLAAVLLTSGAWDFPVAPEVFAPMMASSAGNAETHEGFLRPPFGLC